MQNLPAPYCTLVSGTVKPTQMPADDRHADAWHQWSNTEVAACVHAWASGRPLLVRGEAGCGKSQLARALAALLGVGLITETIHPRYEATDLLYREDPVKRLAQAQLLAAIKPEAQSGIDAMAWLNGQLNPNQFIDQGPIWRAMTSAVPTGEGRDHKAWPRSVVLIDEIDKADSDIPNALLDVLGNRSFTVHPTGATVSCNDDHRPLIVITTNEDRELPPAFVRRCAVLNLKPDDATEATFTAWLIARARAHTSLQPLDGDASSPLAQAAAQVWADRTALKKLSLPTVGLAEYLDLLYSLLNLSAGNAARASELLNQISPYALVKQRDQNQSRAGLNTAPANAPAQSD